MMAAVESADAHFRDCVRGDSVLLCDGTAGLRILEWLTAADRSIADGGRPVELAH
jgi:hypothetical protein